MGQCEGVTYGFKAKYGDDQQTQVAGSVEGKITSLRLYFYGDRYTLEADNHAGVTSEPLYLLKADGSNLTQTDAPGGIYDITAVRLDANQTLVVIS